MPPRRSALVVVTVVAIALALAPSAGAAQRTAPLPYRNASLPVERRVDDLLARMTLDEKVAQMLSLW
jgi:beta-glucosidase